MKKVAFIHATKKVTNANNRESLILEKVPVGLLSRERELNRECEETILESVLKDFALVNELDEITVITSLDDVDQEIIDIASSVAVDKKISWYRVSDEDRFAITEENTASYDGHWPYERLPVYGAWHYEGFFAIAKTRKAEVALVMQADHALMCDCAYLSHLLGTYTQKGLWVETTDKRAQWGIVNVQFLSELCEKYKTRMESFNDRKNNKLGIRINKALMYHQEDTSRKDFIMQKTFDQMPCSGLYSQRELKFLRALAEKDTDFIKECVSKTSVLFPGVMPTLCHAEIIDARGKKMSLDKFTRYAAESAQSDSIINMITHAWDEEQVRQCVNAVSACQGDAFLEIDEACIESISPESLVSLVPQVKMIHLHVNEKIDSAVLATMLDALSGIKDEHLFFVVLQITPGCIPLFGAFENRVDRFLVKSNGAVKTALDMIDFAPYVRVPCKKIDHTLMVRHDGTVAPCTHMKESYDVSAETTKGLFCSDALKHIRDAHRVQTYDFSGSCSQCKEWYIPDAVYSLGNMLFPLVFEKLVATPYSEGKTAEECGVFFRELCQIDDLCQEAIKQCVVVDSSHRHATAMAWRVAQAVKRLFIPLGDQLCQLGEVEKALDAWERVLKYDPSNEYIHGRLDELLANNA